MIESNDPILRSTIKNDEGFRGKVYDDEDGKPIGPGSTIEGHPTVGYGRALDTNGVTMEEAEYLLSNDINTKFAAASKYPYWNQLTDTRQRVLVEMVFQMGGTGVPRKGARGVDGFVNFHSANADGDWDTAADEMLDSAWAKETPARANRASERWRAG